MKKIIAAMLMSMMVLSLAGCGKTGLGTDWAAEDEDVEVYELEDGSYYYEGRLESKMKTAWFDFSVDDAYCTVDAIGGYTPSAGNELVVIEIDVKNTFSESIPMSNYDFQLQWGDGDQDYAWPVEVSEDIIDDQLPAEYELGVKDSVHGYLVYEAPEGEKDFSISFVEYYEDNSEGNGFWVYFTADEK